VLILPAVERISLHAYEAIASYIEHGGAAIAVGTTPQLAPGLLEQKDSGEIAALSTKIFQSAGHPGVLLEAEKGLPDALHHALSPDLDARGQSEGLGFIHRRLDGSDLYFIANTSNHSIDCAVHLRTERRGYEVWNPDDGSVLEGGAYGSGTRIALQLAPYESRVVVLGESQEAIQPQDDRKAQIRMIADLSTGWKVRFGKKDREQNVALPASWTMLDGRQFYSGEAVYSRSLTIARAPDKGVRLWLDFGDGIPSVDSRPPGAPGMRALLDPPIREAAIVEMNGQRVGALWHPPYRIEITSLVHRGENSITVHVYNTAINAMAGQPKRDFTALNAKYGKRFEMQDMNHLQPIPSGVLGAVHLIEGSAK